MSDQAIKRLVVIDGKSVFYRGYYAMPNLATKDGTTTGGVFGFATMALEVLKRLKPDYVAVAWDKPKTNIRRRLELYPEYKAGRKPAPPDFYAQVPILHELLDAFGWPLYELDDYEADDIMGALALQAGEQDIETLLVTSDMDMLQLVNDRVKVYALKTGLSNIELYSPATFEAKYGLRVAQFLDLKSLKGDSSDNIPGVPGIGEKTAVDLLQTYQTLDGVYENLALVRDSVRKKLEAGKDLAYLSREIARIWTDAPLPLDLPAMDGHLCNAANILAIFDRLEFKNLGRQLPEVMQTAIGTHQAELVTAAQPPLGTISVIDSYETLSALHIAPAERLFIASLGTKKQSGDPLVLVLSVDGLVSYVFDLTKLAHEQVVDFLITRCNLPAAQLVGYDVKATLKLLLTLGLADLPPVGHDVLVGAFMLNSLRREQSLDELSRADLGYAVEPFDNVTPEQYTARAPEIIAIIKALYKQQMTELEAVPKLPALAHDIEWPVIPVLARMEHEGIKLDTAYLAQMSQEINQMTADMEQRMYALAGSNFTIGSPAQLATILFSPEHLHLSTAGIKKGKTGYSTAASELDKLRGQHEIIDLITQWREVTKLKNTYIDTLPAMVDYNSRLHTTFNLTIAQTGRLSSVDPNLQNIPVRTDLGRRIRTAFVAGPGNKLVSADYSQFELRLSAAMSGDQGLIDLFNQDTDVHTATAALVYDRQPEDVTKQMRSMAKAVNFGIIYGMSTHGLVAATGMTYDQASRFLHDYLAIRQPLVAYLDSLKAKARQDGYVETLFGRRRPMPDIQSSNFAVRSAAERAAMNMPIQGTEADLMKLAAIRVEERLQRISPDCKQLLQIHDSILVECPEPYARDVAHALKEVMEAIYPELPVKLTVDTTTGDNWGDL